MKNIKFLSALFVLFSAVTFTSCDTEPVDPVLNENNNNNGPAVFTVDFSGETFVATGTQAVMQDGVIAISGVKGADGESVSLLVMGTTAGAYDGDDALMVYAPNADSEYQYTNVDWDTGETSGSVVITEIDTQNHTISGTFSFTGSWSDAEANLPTIAFTNGSFENIPYTGNTGGNPGDEYMNATIDGTDTEFSNFASLSVGDMMTISGFNMANSSNLQLVLPADITVGTYDITDNPFDGPTAVYFADEESWDAIDGSLTIISTSGGFIKGTFSFTAQDFDEVNTIEVTNGEFNIEL